MASPEPTRDPVARNRDVAVKGVLLFGFWLAVCGIAIFLLVWGIFRLLERGERAHDKPLSPMVAASLQRTPPEPRLEPDPLVPRLKARAQEDALLSTYGWIDRNAGTVRIPVDRAMDLVAARGLPPSKPMLAAAAASTPAAPGVRP